VNVPAATKKFADYLAYLALRLVAMFLHMFDWRTVYRLCAWIGDVWYRLDRRHRDRAADHLRPAFGDWPEAKVQQTVRGSFRSMVYLAVEVLLTTRLITCFRWRRHIVLTKMPEAFRLLLARRSGMIFVAGHFGGWEVVGYTMAALGFDGYAVARPLDNEYLNEYLMGVRERMGLRILDKRGAAGQMDDIFASRDYVSFIADQDAGRSGVFVDFLGRQASSYKAPALMAMRHNVPVAVGYGRRLNEQYHFELGVQRIIHPSEWADKDDPVRWITQEYTAALEQVVRSDPKQYLWIYRRWKTRPRGQSDRPKDAERPPASGN